MYGRKPYGDVIMDEKKENANCPTEDDDDMLPEYDFSRMKRVYTPLRNPYAESCTETITISIPKDTMTYFMEESEETGIPLDQLISVRLLKFVETQEKPSSNPFAIYYNKQMSLSIDSETYVYFKKRAEERGRSLSTFFRVYLANCADKMIDPLPCVSDYEE